MKPIPHRRLAIAITWSLLGSALSAQQAQMRGDGPAPAPRPASVSRLDPDLDALIAPEAKVELVATGFGLNEGTTWVRDGHGGGVVRVGGRWVLVQNGIEQAPPPQQAPPGTRA